MKHFRLKKGAVAFALVLSIIMSTVTASASTNWRKGGFSGGTSWSTWQYVNATDTTRHKFPLVPVYYMAKDVELHFYSYTSDGKKEKGTTMYVEIYKSSGDKWSKVYDGAVKTGGKVKLKASKLHYSSADAACKDNRWRIRIRRNSKSVKSVWWAIKAARGKWS